MHSLSEKVMTDRPFVGREQELPRLEKYLDADLTGRGQVCFVAGEPGAGKTALVREFARRSQAKHDDLLVAVGDCNAKLEPADLCRSGKSLRSQVT
jgi:Cdc6-like AAA superfamily ATPase